MKKIEQICSQKSLMHREVVFMKHKNEDVIGYLMYLMKKDGERNKYWEGIIASKISANQDIKAVIKREVI